MVYYEPVKLVINLAGVVEVIINVVVYYYRVSESIVIDQDLLFTLKFWSLLYYFLRMKRKLSTTFYLLTDSHTKRQNSMIEVYLRAFLNWEQNNWVKLLPMTEFAYNNVKNANTGHTPIKLNYGYHPRVFFKEDVDPHSKSCFANKLAEKLRKLMEVCYQILLYVQELQKKAHNKGVKSYSYAPGEMV